MSEIDRFENATDYEFEDISSEMYRTYDFEGVDVTINGPVALAVSDNGHRVFDSNGVCHYVGFDGFYLKWETKDGEPDFVK